MVDSYRPGWSGGMLPTQVQPEWEPDREADPIPATKEFDALKEETTPAEVIKTLPSTVIEEIQYMIAAGITHQGWIESPYDAVIHRSLVDHKLIEISGDGKWFKLKPRLVQEVLFK